MQLDSVGTGISPVQVARRPPFPLAQKNGRPIAARGSRTTRYLLAAIAVIPIVVEAVVIAMLPIFVALPTFTVPIGPTVNSAIIDWPWIDVGPRVHVDRTRSDVRVAIWVNCGAIYRASDGHAHRDSRVCFRRIRESQSERQPKHRKETFL